MRTHIPSRRQRDREDRREQILAAARHVFFEDGIRRATVDAIAARADVAKGTVYLYFPTKETLLAHLLLEGLDSLGERLARAYDDGAALTGEVRLRRLAAAYYDFSQAEPDYFRLMMAFDRGQFQDSVRADVYQRIVHRSLRSLKWVVDGVQQALDEGEFEPSPGHEAARRMAGMLWAALNGVLVLTSHPLRRELVGHEVKPLYTAVLDTMLRGLKAIGK